MVDFTHLNTHSNDKIHRKAQKTHKNKLYNLGFFELDKECNDPDQVIIKFLTYQLNDVEKSL